ncbi:uncharacterized protein BJ171DRAFT_511701 [Polychytrium aggregatum]|uniref:uncharacterized protein n=1 Tax=Polychytrium aggregatum TaxID=110093 RepID=UPI0022FEC18F|nr:uncharacterized protein BJ171DRAFT_511701 [Polychytrium aggregatum]KAI9203068.1 hypothetical protein BJ171DRAFT_511701 [Polychytrium aggregatum]
MLRSHSLWALLLVTAVFHQACALVKSCDPNNIFCFYAAVRGDLVDFTLETDSSYSYAAIGIGQQMAMSQIMVTWVGPNGSTILSDRFAVDQVEPLVVKNQGLIPENKSVFIEPPAPSKSSLYQYNKRNISVITQTPFIWAVGPSGVTVGSNFANGTIQLHSAAGVLWVDVAGASNVASDATLRSGLVAGLSFALVALLSCVVLL